MKSLLKKFLKPVLKKFAKAIVRRFFLSMIQYLMEENRLRLEKLKSGQSVTLDDITKSKLEDETQGIYRFLQQCTRPAIEEKVVHRFMSTEHIEVVVNEVILEK